LDPSLLDQLRDLGHELPFALRHSPVAHRLVL